MTRRTLVIAGSAAVAAFALKLRNGIETVEAKGGVPKEVKIVQFSDTGQPPWVIERRMADHTFHEIVTEIRSFAATAKDLTSLQEFCVEIIAEGLPYYDWVGFYMLDPMDENVLVLGPYRGASTEHVRIPVTEGICGAAVAQRETVIVGDVSADTRYLACSLETKSEIVVPNHTGERIVGEIDVDSHTLNAFGPEDRSFLEECAEVFGQFLEVKSRPRV